MKNKFAVPEFFVVEGGDLLAGRVPPFQPRQSWLSRLRLMLGLTWDALTARRR